MPSKCCITNCISNKSGSTAYISTYNFPIDKEKRQQWEKILKISSKPTSRICEKHFDEHFIVRGKYVKNKKSKLVYHPYARPHLQRDAIPKSRTTEFANLQTGESEKINFEYLSNHFKTWIGSYFGYYCDVSDDYILFCKITNVNIPHIEKSVKIEKDLSFTMYKKDCQLSKHPTIIKISKIDDIKEILTTLNKTNESVNENNLIYQICELLIILRSLKECQAIKINFLISQIKLLQYESPRYDCNTIIASSVFSLLHHSAYQYIRLCHYITLPHPVYLKKLVSELGNEESGINFSKRFLQNKFNLLDDNEKYINIMFRGFCAGEKNVQVFMIRSILSKHKDIVATYLTKTLKATLLLELLNEVLKILTEIGYITISIIAENNLVNKKMFCLLNKGNLLPSFQNPYKDNNKIFILFDSVQIFRNIKNNWLRDHDKTFYIPILNEDKMYETQPVPFSLIKSLYLSDKQRTLKLAPSLSDKVISPSSFEKQNVNLTIRLFDEKNADALKIFFDKEPERVEPVVFFLRQISTWWKIINCDAPKSGIQSGEVIQSIEDAQMIFLQNFLEWLERWNDLEVASGKLTKETFTALQHTTKTMLLLSEYLLNDLKIPYVPLIKFRNDALEGRFDDD